MAKNNRILWVDDEIELLRSHIFFLTEKGYEWGTHSVIINRENGAERIDDIEGATYFLDEKGEIVENELKGKDIFKEKIEGDLTKYKFTLPSLKPGCVIEISYKVETENLGRIRDWVFQYSEPVLWSEYRIRSPKNIAYSAVYRGFEEFFINENLDTYQVFTGSARSYLGSSSVECSQMRWVIKDAPAIREENFITTTDDYKNKVEVQLAGYFFNGIGKKNILGDWPTLIDELIDLEHFGERIDDTRKVKKQAEAIIAGLTSDEEKISAIYNWVKNSIVWDGSNRMFADKEVNDILEEKSGSSAEINFLLLSMLKSIGINGDPVILSTRANGKIQVLYPIYSQFNYVIAKVKAGEKILYLDATDPLRPIDMLPIKILNVKGLVIKKGAVEWVNISSDRQSTRRSLTNINLNEDGSINGNTSDSYLEYGALSVRKELKDKKENELAKEIFDAEKTGLTLDSINVKGKDNISTSLEFNAAISSSNYAVANGDLIYIAPQITHRLEENPLKAKIRKFPIDYGYRSNFTNVINLYIPNGYEVKEGLKNVNYAAALGGISFSRQFTINGNQIQILSKFNTKNIEIKPQFYEQVKEFYSRMIAAQAEQIVLQKNNNQPVQTSDAGIKK